MPIRSKKTCATPGCAEVTHAVRCAAHTKMAEKMKGTSAQRGYDARWRIARGCALRRDSYLCQACLKKGRPQEATEVHHLRPISEAPELRLDLDNLQSLCGPCHREISEREHGFFGRIPGQGR